MQTRMIRNSVCFFWAIPFYKNRASKCWLYRTAYAAYYAYSGKIFFQFVRTTDPLSIDKYLRRSTLATDRGE